MGTRDDTNLSIGIFDDKAGAPVCIAVHEHAHRTPGNSDPNVLSERGLCEHETE
jgi:hypothetical protein